MRDRGATLRTIATKRLNSHALKAAKVAREMLKGISTSRRWVSRFVGDGLVPSMSGRCRGAGGVEAGGR